MALETSILKSTKKVLQISDDDESFDLDIMTHINSAFSSLTDIGVGPVEGYVIDDEDTEWDDFLPETDLVKMSKVKTYVFLKTKMLFDPPQTSFLMESIQKQIIEHEWRLNANREATEYTDPDPPILVETEPSISTGGRL